MPDKSADPRRNQSKPGAAEASGAPLDFDAIFRKEQDQLERRRGARMLPTLKEDPRLAGLAFSGGGIRSAAVCLGALQGLKAWNALGRFDYLSTVSGGGYIGTSLSAAMSSPGGQYPFGDSVEDSPVVRWLRNYSNYLLPRDRSSIRNWLEAIAILLRGLVANAVCVACFLFAGVILTLIAYPDSRQLGDVNFLPRLVSGFVDLFADPSAQAKSESGLPPFFVPLVLLALLAIELVAWAAMRSVHRWDGATDDTSSFMLRFAFVLLAATGVAAYLDAQPLVIRLLVAAGAWLGRSAVLFVLPLGAIVIAAIAFFGGRLGRFLETSKRSTGAASMSLRIATQAMLVAGALVLPLLVWSVYAAVYSWVAAAGPLDIHWGLPLSESRFDRLVQGFVVTLVIMLGLRANGYSLHWLYRDRLGHAFLGGLPDGAARTKDSTAPDYDKLKLSALAGGDGPFHILNAALNVEGSLEANKRGRNADFFIFTPLHAGSELTTYVPVATMESADPRLDLAGAMAISGAAASANMGASTIRVLSPTLSLMNVRLGYYLPNPRFVSAKGAWARALMRRIADRFFLLVEMFNLLTEDRGTIYLTDGGHIENLGIYALLRRKCRLILAVDAEADPNLGCGSLLKLERYARIDLGVRITLPWEEIARQSRTVSASLGDERAICDPGPHCAIGRIVYGGDIPDGMIVYVKSSLSGDEKDYILDYARRNGAFPHEATSDQFFSEEQFEMYRALGFHMIDGLFGEDRVSVVEGEGGWETVSAAREELKAFLGASKGS